MTGLARDARFGLRLLWRSPGVTVVAVLALALGIGANTAIFSVVHATLLAPLPYPEPEQLVMVWSKTQGDRRMTSVGDYQALKRDTTVFQDLNAFGGQSAIVSFGDAPEQVDAGLATPGFYTMVGEPMFLGRDFLPAEGQADGDPVAIITHNCWASRFGRDPAVLGRQVRIDGRLHGVVGVLGPGLNDKDGFLLAVPYAFTREQIDRRAQNLLVMGRLRDGVSLAQANGEVETVAHRIAGVDPASHEGWSVAVEPLKNDFLSKKTIVALWLLLGAVTFVLLIACTNVANLLLAQGTARHREIAVRASLGATRSRLFRQLLAESLLLALAGGAAGVGLAWALVRTIVAAMPPGTLPIEADVRLSAPVLVFTSLVALASGLIFGCLPAWQATRVDLNTVLKEEGSSGRGGRRHALRRALVVGEFALALTLLAGGSLAVHSLVKLLSVDLGFRHDHLLTFKLPVPQDRLASSERVDAFYRQLMERVEAVPGVASVSVSTGMPIRGSRSGVAFQVVGRPVDPAAPAWAAVNVVTPDYFRTLEIPMVHGRAFTRDDREGTERVAIVNGTFAEHYLQGLDPLAQRLRIRPETASPTAADPSVEWRIVGVSRTARNGSVRDEAIPEIDVPFSQSPRRSTVVAVRTSIEPEATIKDIAAAVHALDPELPLADVKTMSRLVNEDLAGDRFRVWLFGGFATLGLLLAAIGIYGVMSFAVAQRTHEIGLRMALGAGRGRIVRDILAEGLVTALCGLALGSAGAYGVGRAMRGLWYGVGTLEPASFALVAAALLSAAVLACIVPARRAASVDPMAALRQR